MDEPLPRMEGLESSARIALAVRAVERDEHLRFFLRRFLSTCGVLPQQSVFTTDQLQNAFDQGMQAAGLHLVGMLSSSNKLLWPQLQLEEMTDEPPVE